MNYYVSVRAKKDQVLKDLSSLLFSYRAVRADHSDAPAYFRYYMDNKIQQYAGAYDRRLLYLDATTCHFCGAESETPFQVLEPPSFPTSPRWCGKCDTSSD